MQDVNVVVVGAGLGGLSLAVALQRAGIPVHLYDQAPELSEVGAGIMLTPNASWAMRSIGVLDAIDALAQRPTGTRYRDAGTAEITTRVVYDESFERKYGCPYFTIHRGDLQAVLRDAVLANDPNAITLNHTVVDYRNEPDRAVAIFANGVEVGADLLVAADGARSPLRNAMHHIEPPRFTGNVAWRGMVPIEDVREPMMSTDTSTWVGPGQHFVHYTVKLGAFMNYVAIAESDEWQEEGWSTPSTIGELLDAFPGWHPIFRELIEATPPDRCFKWGLFDRDPIPEWQRGRATLLGDAAHPTLPFMAQGAAMSMEDAIVLARCIQAAGSVDEALKMYERARKARGGWVQLTSRTFGDIYHARVSTEELAAERKKANDVLYGYDAATVPLT
jgi:salicylate hydroxylase